MPNEHAEVQQQMPRDAENQHSRHQISLHSSQASLLQGYGARGRGSGGGKALQGNGNSGSSNLNENPYQKEAMDYYMSMSGKERSRRGSQGLEYGADFGYSDVVGQVPHQYRHAGNGPGSSVMSHYQLDYTASAASGGNGSSNSSKSRTGAFSPSHQYCLSQNPSIQSTPGHPMHPRQQGQDYPSRHPFPQRPHHRGYPLSGHRPLPQFSRFPLSNASTESARLYNFAPQRYHSGGTISNFECEINSVSGNSKTGSNHSSVKPSNMAQFDSGRLNYTSSNYPSYDFRASQSHHKQSVYSHRFSQNNLKPDYDASNKIICSSLSSSTPYPKYPQTSIASSNFHNSPMPQFLSQEMPKSVTQPQTQQPQVHPNFSPISNPSPAPSGIQSPNCSSSPSPLMGASEGPGNSTANPNESTSHTSIPSRQSSHKQLSRTVPQLSPTPSSNSSVSSFGSSSGNVNMAGINAIPSGSHLMLTQSHLGRGKICDDNCSSLYQSSVDKLPRDPGINSLNALTSQVDNLPNTVQHMLLSDSFISKNGGKDEPACETEHYQMLQNSRGLFASQQRCKATSNSCNESTAQAVRMARGDAQSDSEMNECTKVIKQEGEENYSGGGDGRIRQISVTSAESDLIGYNLPSQCQAKETGNGSQGLSLKVEIGASKIKNQEGNEHNIHSTSPSSSPSSLPSSIERSPNIPPSCTLAPSTCTSVSPLPTSKSPKEPSVMNDQRNCNKPKKNDVAIDRIKKTHADMDITETLGEWRSDLPRIANEKLESHQKCKAEEAQKGSLTLRGNMEDCEKRVKSQNFDNPITILKTGETQNTGAVGVIVSTRSDVTEHDTLSESSQDASSAPHLDNELENSRNSIDKTLSSIVLKGSRCVNGQSGSSICTLSSINGTNIPPEPSCEQSPSCHHAGNQRSPYGFSELFGSAVDLKKTGSIGSGVGKEANLRYQGHHQSALSCITGQKKGMGPAGIVRLGRRGTIRDQDIHPQVQQSSPSILQEVLQGYHTDKTYEHTKNSVHVPDTHPQFQNIAHNLSRHSYSLSKSTMPHSLVPQTGISPDHQATLPTATPGKDYPLNLKQGSMTLAGQDPPPKSWTAVGVGTARHESSEKSKISASPNRPASVLQQTTDTSLHPAPKNINLADYPLPHRIPFSNPQTQSSAMQQLLLQNAELIGGNEMSIKKITMSSSSSSSVSSSERCSVICDVSLRTTPEREKDRHKDEVHETCKKTSLAGASVIQQSHSTSLEGPQDNSKENKIEVKMETECIASKEVFNHNDKPTRYPGHLQEKRSAFEQQTRSPFLPVDTSSDNHSLSSGENRHVNVPNVNPSHLYQGPHTLSSNLNLQASSSTRCQSNYPGTDECGGHSGYGFENIRERSQFHPQIPLQHNLPSKFQFGNSQSTKKMQTYSHPHQYSHDTEDKHEWETSHKNTVSKDIMMSSSTGSGGQQYHSQLGMSSQISRTDPAGQLKLSHNQFSRQGTYYDMKMWNLSQSGREAGSIGECSQPVYQTNQPGVLNPGSDNSKGVTEKVKSFPPIPSPHNLPGHSSFAGSTVNLGPQQGRSPVKTERTGETNPLMMRRRVRSFISPIPAKRPHQDLQQQQRSTPSLYPFLSHNTASRHDAGTSSPEVAHSRLAMPNANSNKLAHNMLTSPSSQRKTNIFPPRKGRGLKLEAIVQKITPNVKNNRSLADFVCSPGSSHTDLVHYNSDNQEQESCIEDTLPKTGPGHGSSHSYLDDGLSLEEIMSYKGADEIGPLAPTAYPCDLQQNPPIIKFGTSENINQSAVEDLKQENHFRIECHGPQFTERDCSGEGKEELRLPTDFTLLGPLPPAPPLACPVQASPPPSSSVLSDIQQFTNTYQQLETRRGEDSAESFLRKKLTNSGMGLVLDDYSNREFYGANSFPHNQHQRHCLLPRYPNSHQIHQQNPFGQTLSSMSNPTQLTELKPLENVVPKGYFPSGKKKGRPVGSVNKQKRAQVQTQNLLINTSTVVTTPIPGLTTTAEIIPSTATTLNSVIAPVIDSKESSEVSSNVPQMVNMDVEKKEIQPKVEFEETGEGVCKDNEGQIAKIEEKQRKRRRRVGGLLGKETLQADAVSEGKVVSEIFPDPRKSVFAPYIHVERKEEIGAVCTIVNEEKERTKGERKECGKADALSNVLSSELIKVDRDTETVKEKTKMEQVDANLLQSCTAGKTVPLSGYVLSGPISSESSHSGHLLCCLCKKWANYKNLGDLYGPYYPPEYMASLPKNHPQFRSLGTLKVGNKGADLGPCTTDSTKQDMQQIDPETDMCTPGTLSTENEAAKLHSAPTTKNTTSAVDGGGILEKIGNAYNNTGLVPKTEPDQELTCVMSAVKQEELDQPQQSQEEMPEDVQLRPQHRKLTSHPRFKRRHRPGEDLPRNASSNFKTSLPFQPPPQLYNQNPSEPLAHLTQLPQVPLDPNELWVHEGCITWASGVFLVNGRLYGLQEALDGAMDTSCSYCNQVGSPLGCYSKGCSLRYHYVCAIEADCSLNEENFSLRCPKHKARQNHGPLMTTNRPR